MMEAMRSLLDPKAVAVVGASQRRGRGTNVVANLRDCGFAGKIFAVNPRYQDVLGYQCFPSVSALPASVDCLVVAVAADAACDILEEAHARGIPAAIVLAAASAKADTDMPGPRGCGRSPTRACASAGRTASA
jgi:acyl-CoA synthetase (NDP forming)